MDLALKRGQEGEDGIASAIQADILFVFDEDALDRDVTVPQRDRVEHRHRKGPWELGHARACS